MRPSLIIGLGTTGLRILEAVQELIYQVHRNEFKAKMKTHKVILLNIETDSRVQYHDTPAGNSIQRETATVDSIIAARQSLIEHTGCDMSWFSEDLPVRLNAKAVTVGAGQRRVVGRFALWAKWNQIYNTLSSIHDNYFNQDTPENIYVTGTLGGGSCSGMFIDFGHMLADIFGVERSNHLGLFVLPSNPQVKDAVAHANTMAALEDLEYFRAAAETPDDPKWVFYEYKWPNRGTPVRRPNSPYCGVYFVSDRFEGEGAVRTLNKANLYYMCGRLLFNYITGVGAKAQAQIANAGDASRRSFGLSGFAYPAYRLTELAACQLSELYLRRFIDSENYHPKGTGKGDPLDTAKIDKAARTLLYRLVHDFIEGNGWINDLMEGLVSKRVTELAREWERKVIRLEDLHKQFVPSEDLITIYNQMMNKKSKTIDIILIKTVEAVRDRLNTYESLSDAEHFLRSLEEHRKQLLRLWTKQGVDGTDEMLRGTIQGLTDKYGSLNFEKSKRNAEIVWSYFDAVRIHLLFLAFSSISLEECDPKIGEKTFPSLTELSKIRKSITDTESTEPGVLKEIGDRRQVLANALEDNTLPIMMVYGQGNSNAEVARLCSLISNAELRYRQLHPKGAVFDFMLTLKKEWSSLVALVQEKLSGKMQEYPNILQLVENGKYSINNQAVLAQEIMCCLTIGGMDAGMLGGVPNLLIAENLATCQTVSDEVKAIRFNPNQLCSGTEHRDAILFHMEEFNVEPITKNINYAQMLDYRNQPQENENLAQWEERMDPYGVRARKAKPAAKRVSDAILDLIVAWECPPNDNCLYATGSRFQEFTVITTNGSTTIRLTTNDASITLDSCRYPDMTLDLPNVLIINSQFLENSRNALMQLQLPDFSTEDYRNRWRQMGKDPAEIQNMELHYRNLTQYLG